MSAFDPLLPPLVNDDWRPEPSLLWHSMCSAAVTGGEMGDLKRTILELSKGWMQGWIDQDHVALAEFLAPEYALIVSSVPEHLFDRANWLATAVGPYVCTRLSYDGVQVRDLGNDIAVMSAVADFDATMSGIDRSGRYFVTDVWRRVPESRHGWQVCSRYSSRPGEADASVKAMTNP